MSAAAGAHSAIKPVNCRLSGSSRPRLTVNCCPTPRADRLPSKRGRIVALAVRNTHQGVDAPAQIHSGLRVNECGSGTLIWSLTLIAACVKKQLADEKEK